MRVKVIVATAVVFALSIVSTTFTLLALTSKDWSGQALYDAGYGNRTAYNLTGVPTHTGEKDISPVCVVPRSPFYRCNLPHVYWNLTCELDCQWFQPMGWNKTSCRSAAEFGVPYNDNIFATLLGTSQECQEVHYAGNLQIAASAFIVLAMCASLVLCTGTILLGFMETKRSTSASSNSAGVEGQDAAEAVHHHVESKSHGQRHHGGHGAEYVEVPRHAGSSATPWIVALFLGCLYIGALLQLLAQFFGVLGLTVSATPSPYLESTYFNNVNGTGHDDDGDNYNADTFVIGKALSQYATIAWTSAVLCAAMATLVMRRPRIAKIL